MSPEETKDLEELKLKIQKMKICMYDIIQMNIDHTDEWLAKYAGYKGGKSEMVVTFFEKAQKEIRKLEREYFKKYPD